MSLDLMRQTYQDITGFSTPNPMQQAVWEAFHSQEPLGVGLLLKGSTGSGKTEAVAIPAIHAGKRLIMVYPTRSLVEDQIGRFHTYLCRYSKLLPEKVVTLTVDTGAHSYRYCWQNGDEYRPEDAERLTRHLYYGNVIITTLDKFLYRFFGFGEPLKSYIYPLRIHYMNPLICFDEAHSYESVAFTNFERLVRTLYEKGKDVVLMTATMPPELEMSFDYLDVVDFVSGENAKAMSDWRVQTGPDKAFHPQKQLHYIPASIQRDENTLSSPAIERMIEEAEQRMSPGKRIIVAAESVKDAATIFRRLRQSIQDIPVYLYHGRLTQTRRQEVYAELSQRDSNDQDYLLVSTSAIEVGCDLNAHILITQLCDPDRLIQRAGRCNRKQDMEDAAVIVVGDDVPDWMTALTKDGRAAYVQALQAQDEQSLDTAALIPHIQKKLDSDPRVEVMFDMLYEYVYEAKLENKKLHENGLIITRSWEPSITLCQGEEGDSNKLLEPIAVPISYCRIPQDQEPLHFLAGGGIHKRVYDAETHKYTLKELSGRWESAYNNDIVVCLEAYFYADGTPYERELGYIDLPFLFRGPFPRGPRVIMEHGSEDDKITIWYIDPNKVTGRPIESFVGSSAVSTNSEEEVDTEESEEDDE